MVIRPTISYLLANLIFFSVSPRNIAKHLKLVYKFVLCDTFLSYKELLIKDILIELDLSLLPNCLPVLSFFSKWGYIYLKMKEMVVDSNAS